MSRFANKFGLQAIHCAVIVCFLVFIGYEIFLLVSTIWSPDARSSIPRILVYSFFLVCYLAAVHVVNLLSEREGETGPHPDLRQVLSTVRVVATWSAQTLVDFWASQRVQSLCSRVRATVRGWELARHLRLVADAAVEAGRRLRTRNRQDFDRSATTAHSVPARPSQDPLAAFIRGLDKGKAPTTPLFTRDDASLPAPVPTASRLTFDHVDDESPESFSLGLVLKPRLSGARPVCLDSPPQPTNRRLDRRRFTLRPVLRANTAFTVKGKGTSKRNLKQ